MPFERPTLPELIDQGASELESRLPGVLARVRRSLLGVIVRIVAAGLSALYKFAEFLNRQTWPDRAEAEFLDDHGAVWGRSRTPAVAATGTVRFTGVDGGVIPIGTVLQRLGGQEYETLAEGVIAAGQALVDVRGRAPGQTSNSSVNTPLTLASPIANITSSATAHTALSGGADAESDEPYRARILARIRQAPQGGAAHDYVDWATQVPGVTRAWPYPGELGPGTVVVRFMRDDDTPSGIPDAGEVATVQAHIEQQRPVTAQLTVLAPVAVPLDFSIQLIPDAPALRAAVQAELADLIRREAEPGGTVLLSHIREAISTAVGEVDHQLTSPAANVAHGTGQIATMGAITWL